MLSIFRIQIFRTRLSCQTAAAKERAPLRAGYLGHLTLVANRMIGAAGRRRTVKRFLEDSETWAAFLDGVLKVRLLRLGHASSAWCTCVFGCSLALGILKAHQFLFAPSTSIARMLCFICHWADHTSKTQVPSVRRLITLQERNSNEDIGAWQCGRPDPRSIPSSTPLDADEPGVAPFSEEDMVRLEQTVQSVLSTVPAHTALFLLFGSAQMLRVKSPRRHRAARLCSHDAGALTHPVLLLRRSCQAATAARGPTAPRAAPQQRARTCMRARRALTLGTWRRTRVPAATRGSPTCSRVARAMGR